MSDQPKKYEFIHCPDCGSVDITDVEVDDEEEIQEVECACGWQGLPDELVCESDDEEEA